MNRIEAVLTFIVSFVLAFVPFRYRRRWLEGESASDLGSAAVASGLAEFILALVVFTLRFWATASGRRILSALADPVNLLLFGIVIEGMVRFLAAMVGQSPPLLLLQLVAWLDEALARGRETRLLGPMVPDEVETMPGGDLRVSSCRPKPHWDPYVSIRYRDEFWAPIRHDRLEGPRSHLYQLRKRREDEAVVVVYPYDPRDSSHPGAPVRWTPCLACILVLL